MLTREKHGRLSEGLRECVIEVEMSAGCLKEDGDDAMFASEEKTIWV